MSDDDLRALERGVATTGTVAARLRLSAALERRGDLEASFQTLLPGRHDPEVRRRLARWPAWNGGSRLFSDKSFIDVERLRSHHRAWTFRGAYDLVNRQVFVASALALVCRAASGIPVVLDAVTGNTLWEVAGELEARQTTVVDDVLLVAPRNQVHSLTAHDLWTGAILYSVDLGGTWTYVHDRRQLLFSGGGRIGAWNLRDARLPPERRWSRPWTAPDTGRPWSQLQSIGSFVTHTTDLGVDAIDDSGTTVWKSELRGISDRYGLVGSPVVLNARGERDSGCLVALDRDGRRLWESERRGSVLGLAPDFVFAFVHGERFKEIATIDRESGRVLHVVGMLMDFGAYALVRDAIYSYLYLIDFETQGTHETRLAAIAPDGTPLWRIPPNELGGDVFGIAPVPGRIFTLGRSGLVTCWKAPD